MYDKSQIYPKSEPVQYSAGFGKEQLPSQPALKQSKAQTIKQGIANKNREMGFMGQPTAKTPPPPPDYSHLYASWPGLKAQIEKQNAPPPQYAPPPNPYAPPRQYAPPPNPYEYAPPPNPYAPPPNKYVPPPQYAPPKYN